MSIYHYCWTQLILRKKYPWCNERIKAIKAQRIHYKVTCKTKICVCFFFFLFCFSEKQDLVENEDDTHRTSGIHLNWCISLWKEDSYCMLIESIFRFLHSLINAGKTCCLGLNPFKTVVCEYKIEWGFANLN